jgi:hypothetical protein
MKISFILIIFASFYQSYSNWILPLKQKVLLFNENPNTSPIDTVYYAEVELGVGGQSSKTLNFVFDVTIIDNWVK